MMTKKQTNKPVIEGMINTVALALTSAGMYMLLSKEIFGFGLILFGFGLEWFKYWGRRKYW